MAGLKGILRMVLLFLAERVEPHCQVMWTAARNRATKVEEVNSKWEGGANH